MAKFMRRYLNIIVMFAIVSACVTSMFIVAEKARESAADGLYYISPANTKAGVFTSGEIKSISLREGALIACESQSFATVSTGIKTSYVPVTKVSEDYSDVANLRIINGGFITKLRSFENVAVLSKGLAWEMFGDYNVTGLTLFIDDAECEVLGVCDAEDSFALLPFRENDAAQSLYILSPGEDSVSGYRLCEQILQLLNKNTLDYDIADINRYALSIERRAVFALSVLELGIAAFLFVRAYAEARKLRQNSPTTTKTRWPGLLKTSICAICAIVLLTLVDFDIWIPGFSGGGLRQFWAAFTNAGALAANGHLPYDLQELGRLNTVANSFGIIAIVIGIGLLCVLARRKRKDERNN